MPNNPYDDLLKNLARLLEQITSLEQNMRKIQDGAEGKPGIIGCAIITGGLLPEDQVPQNTGGRTGLSYEMVDAGERAFLTVPLPAGFGNAPEVCFQDQACHISMNGLVGTIDLQFSIVHHFAEHRIGSNVRNNYLFYLSVHCHPAPSSIGIRSVIGNYGQLFDSCSDKGIDNAVGGTGC